MIWVLVKETSNLRGHLFPFIIIIIIAHFEFCEEKKKTIKKKSFHNFPIIKPFWMANVFQYPNV